MQHLKYLAEGNLAFPVRFYGLKKQWIQNHSSVFREISTYIS